MLEPIRRRDRRRVSPALSPLVLLALVLCAGAAAFTTGCGGDSPPAPAIPPSAVEVLRQRFPAVAARVLRGSEPLAAAGERFAVPLGADPAASLDRRHGLSASLPRRAEGAIHFHLLTGADVQVRELGALGEGSLTDGVAAYPGKSGASFWSATEEGFEEWLMLDVGVATSRAPAAIWEVEGASLREADGAVELSGEGGAATIRVTAPEAFAGGNRPVAARLAVNGARIELWVDGGGEPTLVDPVWSATASMSAARWGHTASVLPNGGVLIAGGATTTSTYLASTEIYNPSTGLWSPAASMSSPRFTHTATVLSTGKVLVVGGAISPSTYLRTAEVYDPVANSWLNVTSMPATRSQHSASLIAGGKVLVAGGFGAGTLSSAVVYDPGANTWTATGAMVSSRFVHTSSLLSNGKVLIAGGYGGVGAFLSSAELYNPATNTWVATPTMSALRASHTATVLASGKVLVAGGQSSSTTFTASVDLYDPTANTWSSAGALATTRSFHAATLLQSGKVLVTGGYNPATLASAEVYDPATNLWSSAKTMLNLRSSHTATLLGNGKVLVAGGYGGSAGMALSELCDPVADTWTSAGSMTTGGRYDHTVTLLPNGKALVIGGSSGSVSLTSTQIYDPATVTWSPGAPMANVRSRHTATLLGSGKVLVTGGYGGASNYLATAEVYTPSTNLWAPAGSLGNSRELHTATLLFNGKVLVAGGYGGSPRATFELYDPATNAFTGVSPMVSARYGHAATMLSSGLVLITGGVGAAILNTTEIYDPAANSWTAAAPMAVNRYEHTAALLTASGRVLVAGGLGTSSYLATAELYDPPTNSWSTAATMGAARQNHVMVGLPAGLILVAGGQNSGGYLGSAEVYDPGANTWSTTTPMATQRGYFAATSTLLASGAVLATGGQNSAGPLASAELYVPAPIDDGNPCTSDVWNASTGQITHAFKVAGTSCADTHLCNGNEVCNGSGACLAGTPVTCAALDVCHSVGTCDDTTGLCSNPVKANGTACNDSNACTQTDTCQAGACTGGNPVVCNAVDQCHNAGSCNPASGTCSNPNKTDGTACNDGNACTQADTCQAGACSGANPVVCAALDQCHSAGACNPTSGVCSTPSAADGTSCAEPNAVAACSGGVCAITSCSAGFGNCNGLAADGCEASTGVDVANCGACGVACAGATTCSLAQTCVTGVCGGGGARTNGTACNDGNACTQADTCVDGQCLGGSLVACSAPDQCHYAGACEPSAGACSSVAKPDATPCDDGNAGTTNDGCVAGACLGGGALPPATCATAGRDFEEDGPMHPGGLLPTCTPTSTQTGWLDVTTCNSGEADWSIAFNAAVNQVLAGNVTSHTIFVPHGTYGIAHSINVHGYGIRIIGEDPATTTLTWTGAPYTIGGAVNGYPNILYVTAAARAAQPWMFLIDSAFAAEIRRLTLDGVGAGEAAIRQGNFSNNGHGVCGQCGDGICFAPLPTCVPPPPPAANDCPVDYCGETPASCPADCPQDPTMHVEGYSSSTQNRFSDLVIRDFARGIWGGYYGGFQDDTTHILRVRFQRIGQAWAAALGKPITALAAVAQSSQNAISWNVQDSTFDHCVTGLWTAGGLATSTNAWDNSFQFSSIADIVASGQSYYEIRGNTSYGSKYFVLGNGFAPGQSVDEDGYSGNGSAGGAPLFMTIEDNVILDPGCPAGESPCVPIPIDLRTQGSFSVIDNSIRSTFTPAIRFHAAFGYTNNINQSFQGNPVILLGNRFSSPQLGAGGSLMDQDNNAWWQAWTSNNQAYYPPVPAINEYKDVDNVQAGLGAYAAPSMTTATPVFRGRELYNLPAIVAANPSIGTTAADAYCGQIVHLHGGALSSWISLNLTGHARPFLYLPGGCYYLDDNWITIPGGLDLQLMGDGISTRIYTTSTDYILHVLAPARATLRDLALVGASMPGGIQINSLDNAGDQVFFGGAMIYGKGDTGRAPLPVSDTTVALLVDGVDHTLVRADHSNFGPGNEAIRVVGGGAGAAGSAFTQGVQLVSSAGGGTTNAPYRVTSWGKIIAQAGEIEQTWGMNEAGGSGYITLTGTRYVVDEGGSAADIAQWKSVYPTQGKLVLDGFQGNVSLLTMSTGLAAHTLPSDTNQGLYIVASTYWDSVDYSFGTDPHGAGNIAPMPLGGMPSGYQTMIDCGPVAVVPANRGAIIDSTVGYSTATWQCQNVLRPGAAEAQSIRDAYADLRASKVATPKVACSTSSADAVLDRVSVTPNNTTLPTGAVHIRYVTSGGNL